MTQLHLFSDLPPFELPAQDIIKAAEGKLNFTLHTNPPKAWTDLLEARFGNIKYSYFEFYHKLDIETSDRTTPLSSEEVLKHADGYEHLCRRTILLHRNEELGEWRITFKFSTEECEWWQDLIN